MKNKPKISVVIPTCGRRESLRRVLDSLCQQTYGDFEIVIVDGGSVEQTRELIKNRFAEFPVRVIPQEGEGLISARNSGWKAAGGSIVTFTDDDVVATPAWLKEIARAFCSSSKIGGVSGPTIIPKERLAYRDLFYFYSRGSFPWSIACKLYEKFFLEGEPRAVGRIFKCGQFSPGASYRDCLNLKYLVDVDYLEACNMSFRKDLVEKVGGFDQHYLGVGDWSEPDLAFKIKGLGYRLVFNSAATVYHLVSREGVYQRRNTDSRNRMHNFVYFYLKNVKPNSVNKAIRFALNLSFMNAYLFYKFSVTRNLDWLYGGIGMFSGFRHVLSIPKDGGRASNQ